MFGCPPPHDSVADRVGRSDWKQKNYFIFIFKCRCTTQQASLNFNVDSTSIFNAFSKPNKKRRNTDVDLTSNQHRTWSFWIDIKKSVEKRKNILPSIRCWKCPLGTLYCKTCLLVARTASHSKTNTKLLMLWNC